MLGKVINTSQLAFNAPPPSASQSSANNTFKIPLAPPKSKIGKRTQAPPPKPTPPLTLATLATLTPEITKELALTKKLSLVGIKELPPETSILSQIEFDSEHLLKSQLYPAILDDPEAFENMQLQDPVPFNFIISQTLTPQFQSS